jgi:hypothetical protein
VIYGIYDENKVSSATLFACNSVAQDRFTLLTGYASATVMA